MIKIEQLKDGAKATIVRNGVKQPVYLAMNITRAELETLEVIGGSLMYTIDEAEIVEIQGGETPVPVKSPEPFVPVEQSAATVETPVETETSVEETQPAIVKPAPRTVKK